ncbi:MAG: tetratricopeptide repeat protein [Chloroflexi bacterium]|nr:tetratricopeptide repeat protein [Chloroflexota bacterium]
MAKDSAHEPELTEGEAVKHFERAAKDNPDATSHFNLGSAYYVAHNLDDALREFQQAVALSPGLDHAHYYLGVIYKARGDQGKAREELEKVVKGSGNPLLKNQAQIQLKWLNGK